MYCTVRVPVLCLCTQLYTVVAVSINGNLYVHWYRYRVQYVPVLYYSEIYVLVLHL